MKDEIYILKKDCPNIGKEVGDYYNGEYGTSVQVIAELLRKGIIEDENHGIELEGDNQS